MSANITVEGKIKTNNAVYNTLESAMHAALTLYPDQSLVPKFKATAWQFWSYYNPRRNAWTPLEHLRGQYESGAQKNKVRTSDSDPLRIDEIKIGKGVLGLTFCPGKVTQGIYGGFWRRDLHQDCERITRWRASQVITLLETHEFDELGVPSLAEKLPSKDRQWLHLPIRDMDIPDHDFKLRWQAVGPTIHKSLEEGARIVIHCRGGLGRTGLLAALILIEFGLPPEDAIQTVRSARQRTIETFAQEEYLLKIRKRSTVNSEQ